MKFFHVLFVASLLLGISGCSRQKNQDSKDTTPDKTVRLIMSDSGFNSEIVPILKSEVAKQGFTLEWVVVNDIIQPNKLVDDGSVEANSFQHEPYLDQFVKDHELKHVVRGFYTIFSPSGLFSKKYKTLEQVPDGATFGIPVDPSNNGRALFMLRDHGLLKLRDVTVIHASQKDIIENPHHFKFKEVDQLMLQRALDDVDVGFLFAATALKAGLNIKRDALALETVGASPFKGVVATRPELVSSPKLKALQVAYHSDALKAYYQSKYGDAIIFIDENGN